MGERILSKWHSMPVTVKASTVYVVCSVLQRAISFFTLPLFTRTLSTEEYGQFTVYFSWQGIFSILLTLNLAYGSFGPAMMKYEDKREEYVSSLEGIFFFLSAVFLVIYIPFRELFNKIFDMPTMLVLVMIFETVALNSTLLWSTRKRYAYKYKSVIVVTLCTALLAPLLSLLLISNMSQRGIARIYGYAITDILIGGGLCLINIYKGKILFDKQFWKYAFGFNIPLLAYYLSQMIFNQSDRIMINYYTGKSDAALYGVAYSFAMLLTFVLNAINNSYVPWLYEKMKKGRLADTKPIASIIAIIMSLLILCVIWFGPEIIYIMAGKEYSEAVYVIPPVSISLLLLFYTQLFTNIEFYFEEKKYLVWASIGAAVLNILLNSIFIPLFGFVAAGYTTLVSYLVFCVSNYICMKLVLRKHNVQDNGYNYVQLGIILIAFIIASFIGLMLYNDFRIRISIFIILLSCCLVNIKKVERYLFSIKENFRIHEKN